MTPAVLACIVTVTFGILLAPLDAAGQRAGTLPTIGIFVCKLLYSFGLYCDRVRCTFRQSIGASLAGLALTYTVGRAVICGLMTSRLQATRLQLLDVYGHAHDR